MRKLPRKAILEDRARATISLRRWKEAELLLHFVAEFSDPYFDRPVKTHRWMIALQQYLPLWTPYSKIKVSIPQN